MCSMVDIDGMKFVRFDPSFRVLLGAVQVLAHPLLNSFRHSIELTV